MDAVSRAILDVAFTKELPPIALNLVHPRPVRWDDVMLPAGKAAARQKNLGTDLRVVSFQEWFSLVEKRAKLASEDDLKNIVSLHMSSPTAEAYDGKAFDQTTRIFPCDCNS
jgi:hypothetical protein